jgi:hypothetical protein
MMNAARIGDRVRQSRDDGMVPEMRVVGFWCEYTASDGALRRRGFRPYEIESCGNTESGPEAKEYGKELRSIQL